MDPAVADVFGPEDRARNARRIIRWWQVTAVNTGSAPASVQMERTFQTTNWNVAVAPTNVVVSRPDPHRAFVTFDVAPGETFRFLNTVIEQPPD